MPLHGVLATGTATYADLRRRHGVLLSALAVAVLLLLLPDICARAVDESAALGLQVGLSTIAVFLALLGGLAGLRCGAADGDLGATSEWRTSPITPLSYVLGRFGGIAAILVTAFVLLAPFLVAVQLEALRTDPPSASVIAFAVLGALLSAALFGALGMLLAASSTGPLAAVLFVATLVATRTIVPALAARRGVSGWIAAVLPDPSRLDLSRELAFHRPLDTASMSLACASAALQTAAFLCAAAWLLERRET